MPTYTGLKMSVSIVEQSTSVIESRDMNTTLKYVFHRGLASKGYLLTRNARILLACLCNRTSVYASTRDFHSGNVLTVSKTKDTAQKLDAGLRGQEEQTLKLESQPPEARGEDWIGPADPDSNLRPRKYFIPEDETPTERAFRIKQEETFKWNQQFWANHNKLYAQSKERYIQQELARLGPTLEDGSPRRLSPEHLSIFYKRFLDENHRKHRQYNIEWYKRNIKLLWPAFQVMCIRTFWKRTRKALPN